MALTAAPAGPLRPSLSACADMKQGGVYIVHVHRSERARAVAFMNGLPPSACVCVHGPLSTAFFQGAFLTLPVAMWDLGLIAKSDLSWCCFLSVPRHPTRRGRHLAFNWQWPWRLAWPGVDAPCVWLSSAGSSGCTALSKGPWGSGGQCRARPSPRDRKPGDACMETGKGGRGFGGNAVVGAPAPVLNRGCSLICKQPGKALSET